MQPRRKQWLKAIATLLIGFTIANWLNEQTSEFYAQFYLSHVGEANAGLLGTLTHVCFYVPALIAYQKLKPARIAQPATQKPYVNEEKAWKAAKPVGKDKNKD
jgi:hypothetical protein